jgi:hypothetical protein
MKKYIFISFFILTIVILGDKKELYTVEKCEAEQNIYHQAVLKLEKEWTETKGKNAFAEACDESLESFKVT